jgi:hypothetical protein
LSKKIKYIPIFLFLELIFGVTNFQEIEFINLLNR